jgi:hypothetical protein
MHMYSSRRHLCGAHNYYLSAFLFAFLRRALQRRVISTGNAKRNRRSKVLLRVVCFVGVLSLPLCVSLVRNYQWERSQPPTTVVPDLTGLPLMTGTERAHSVHLTTKVLGRTWYTNLSPGQITLQSPEAGQRVPFETTIGVELAIMAPAWVTAASIRHERKRCNSPEGFTSKTDYEAKGVSVSKKRRISFADVAF